MFPVVLLISIGKFNHLTCINNHAVSEELSEELLSELLLPGNNSTVASQTFELDPTMTMDLTTMNPPNGHDNTDDDTSNMDAAEGGDAAEAKEIDEVAGTTTKEAESSPSNMDMAPERPSHDDAPKVNMTQVAMMGSVNDDDYLDETAGNVTSTSASEPASLETQEDSAATSPAKTSTAKHTISTTLAPSQERVTTFSPSFSPTAKVTLAKILITSSPTEMLITSAPTELLITSSPTETWITPSPTVEYVEPSDDSLDPVANEKNADDVPFENGEATSPMEENNNNDDEALPLDDWGEDYDEALLKDNEEEVKKVGGWLSVASIILMIYTAYQMSENPDGICAR
jgi:hypothetical protein